MKRGDFLLSLFSGTALFSPVKKKPVFVEKFANPVKAFCNFTGSFVTHITPGKTNQARINIEARTIVQNSNGSIKDYFKFASCKSENTYAKENLFMDPNYDFSGVYNASEFVIFRSRQYHNENYSERGQVKSRFDSIRIQLLEQRKVFRLDTVPEIVKATIDGRNLIGRTTFNRNEVEKVILEYPIKTMNVNDIEFIYQVDTGPVVIPHPKKNNLNVLDSLELAFLAFNRSDIAYFVFNSPTPIEGLPEVTNNHYSEIIAMTNVVNEIYQVN